LVHLLRTFKTLHKEKKVRQKIGGDERGKREMRMRKKRRKMRKRWKREKRREERKRRKHLSLMRVC